MTTTLRRRPPRGGVVMSSSPMTTRTAREFGIKASTTTSAAAAAAASPVAGNKSSTGRTSRRRTATTKTAAASSKTLIKTEKNDSISAEEEEVDDDDGDQVSGAGPVAVKKLTITVPVKKNHRYPDPNNSHNPGDNKDMIQEQEVEEDKIVQVDEIPSEDTATATSRRTRGNRNMSGGNVASTTPTATTITITLKVGDDCQVYREEGSGFFRWYQQEQQQKQEGQKEKQQHRAALTTKHNSSTTPASTQSTMAVLTTKEESKVVLQGKTGSTVGSTISHPTGGWHVGMIAEIFAETEQVTVQLLDNSSVTVPAADVVLLRTRCCHDQGTADKNDSSSSVNTTNNNSKKLTNKTTAKKNNAAAAVVATTGQTLGATWIWQTRTPDRTVTAVRNPNPAKYGKLQLGDCVMGFFQAGVEDAWYRGRVCAITSSVSSAPSSPSSSPRPPPPSSSEESSLFSALIDIAYDDGDVERNVPLTDVILLQKGREHPQWLQGLTIPVPHPKRITLTAGVVVMAVPYQPLLVEYTDEEGNKTTQKVAYMDAVQALMKSVLQQAYRVVEYPLYLAGPPPQLTVPSSPSKGRCRRRRQPHQQQARKGSSKTSSVVVVTTTPDRCSSTSSINGSQNKHHHHHDESDHTGYDSSDDEAAMQRLVTHSVLGNLENYVSFSTTNREKGDRGRKRIAGTVKEEEQCSLPKPLHRRRQTQPKKEENQGTAQQTKRLLQSVISFSSSSNEAPAVTKKPRRTPSEAIPLNCVRSSAIDGTCPNGTQLRDVSKTAAPQVVAVAMTIQPSRSTSVVVYPRCDFADTTGSTKATSVTATKVLLDSVADDWMKALDSNEPQYGDDLLTFVAYAHQKVPTGQYITQLMELLRTGPKTSRGPFPDPTRMELALRYLHQLVECHGLAYTIAESLSTDYLDQLFDNTVLTGESYYLLPGDERRTDAAALHRIALTLQTRACAMEGVNLLLAQLLHDCMGHSVPWSEVQTRPLIASIATQYRGPQNQLERAMQVYRMTWRSFGPLVIGALASTCEPGIAYDEATTQARRLLKVMGSIVSWLTLLFMAATSESSRAVCDLVGNKLEHPGILPLSSSSKSKQSHDSSLRKRILLNSILHLDDTLVPELMTLLANAWGVESEFNHIRGGWLS